jgi:hypothetical protein
MIAIYTKTLELLKYMTQLNTKSQSYTSQCDSAAYGMTWYWGQLHLTRQKTKCLQIYVHVQWTLIQRLRRTQYEGPTFKESPYKLIPNRHPSKEIKV